MFGNKRRRNKMVMYVHAGVFDVPELADSVRMGRTWSITLSAVCNYVRICDESPWVLPPGAHEARWPPKHCCCKFFEKCCLVSIHIYIRLFGKSRICQAWRKPTYFFMEGFGPVETAV